MESRKQDMTIDHFAIRVREPERVAAFYADVFELEPRNVPREDGSYSMTDGRVTMAILPWKISDFNGAGIEQPALDHIGFRTADLGKFIAIVAELKTQNPALWPRDIDFNDEGRARMALLERCPRGDYRLADPDGTLIDVAQDH
jgi:catechol 2,3-dioxygenase-like lactoylglutathione lyase family enzyme